MLGWSPKTSSGVTSTNQWTVSCYQPIRAQYKTTWYDLQDPLCSWLPGFIVSSSAVCSEKSSIYLRQPYLLAELFVVYWFILVAKLPPWSVYWRLTSSLQLYFLLLFWGKWRGLLTSCISLGNLFICWITYVSLPPSSILGSVIRLEKTESLAPTYCSYSLGWSFSGRTFIFFERVRRNPLKPSLNPPWTWVDKSTTNQRTD